MSLPPLAALPVSLQPFVSRAQETFLRALGESSEQVLAAWPAARRETFGRVCAASDFVSEQVSRDPQMLLELAETGLLERALAPGEMRDLMTAALAECDSEDALAVSLRRFRNRHQVRIVWRDLARQADLAQTCRELSDMADACVDLAYQ